MRRVSHDLSGLAQRFTVLANQLEAETEATQEIWKDERGNAFLREHLSPFKPTVAQLVACLNETNDLFESLAKKLGDPDRT